MLGSWGFTETVEAKFSRLNLAKVCKRINKSGTSLPHTLYFGFRGGGRIWHGEAIHKVRFEKTAVKVLQI